MNPVARIIPEAKALTMANRLLSGFNAGIERVTNGSETPIILVIRIETMAIIFSGSAFCLLLQEFEDSASHSDGTTETACFAIMEIIISMKNIVRLGRFPLPILIELFDAKLV